MLLVTERVTRSGVLEANAGNDIAGGALLTIHAVIGVHLKDAAQTLATVLDGVIHIRACFGLAGIDANIGQLTNIRVGHDLEGKSREGLFDVCVTYLFLTLEVGAVNLRHVKRAWKIVDNGVEKFLDTLVLVGGTHKDGVHLAGKNAGANSTLKLVNVNLFSLKNCHHEVFGEVGGSLKKLLALLGSNLCKLSWNLIKRLRVNHALCILFEVPRRVGNKVNETPEVGLGTHRNLCRNCGSGQTLFHGLDGVEEVGAHAVKLIDERDTRHVVLGCLTPNRLGLWLDARNGVKDGNGTVEDAKRTLDLSGKVNVTRGVDDLDNVVLPEARGCCGRNGYAALLLLDHPVHGCRTVMDLTDFVSLAGVVKNALRSGGLTSINVSHNTDVTEVFQIVLGFSHCIRYS